MSLSWVWTGLIIYIAIALAVAFGSKRGTVSDLSGYFLGSRAMGGVVSALSYSATTYSAFMMVGLAGLTYKGGVGAFGFEMIYFTGMSLVLIFGPRFWMAGKEKDFVTPSEMLGYRYGNKTVALIAAVISCLFLIPYSAVQLAGVGYLLSGMTDGAIPYIAGVIVAAILAILFSAAAGIRSVMWTDALQALLMIVSSAFVVFFLVDDLGGLSGFFTKLESHSSALSVPGNGFFNFWTFLGLTVPWFFFSLSNPQVSQRLFMPKSMKSMRQMLLLFLVFGFIYTIVSVFWGFSAVLKFPGLGNADLATPSLLASAAVPKVLGLIVMIGILAAAVSTIDSILLTLSSMFARDIYNGKETREEKQLIRGKFIIPVIALLAFIFALFNLNLIAVLSVAASAGLLVTVPPLVGAFFWKRGSAAGAVTGMIAGAAAVIILEVTGRSPLHLASGIWGLIISTALFIAVSFATKPASEQAYWFTKTLPALIKAPDKKNKRQSEFSKTS